MGRRCRLFRAAGHWLLIVVAVVIVLTDKSDLCVKCLPVRWQLHESATSVARTLQHDLPTLFTFRHLLELFFSALSAKHTWDGRQQAAAAKSVQR